MAVDYFIWSGKYSDYYYNYSQIMMPVGGVMWAVWVQAPVDVTASPPLNPAPRLPSKLREMCPFTASRAFQRATLAVAPQFFQTGSSELALMAGKLQAHISICQPNEPLFPAICRVLLWRKAHRSGMRLGYCRWTQRTPSEFISPGYFWDLLINCCYYCETLNAYACISETLREN